MPKALHRKLARKAKRKGLKGDSYKRYVYGTLQKVESLISKKGGK